MIRKAPLLYAADALVGFVSQGLPPLRAGGCDSARALRLGLYEAPTAEAIVAAARRANVPADAVVEVGAGTPEFSDRLQNWAEGVRSS